MIGYRLAHYDITAELGRGGMGIVYRAEDTKLDRTVAIKVLPSSALTSEDDRARFYREAKAAAQLQHQHIAAVFEIDEAVPEGAPSDDVRPFIAMEYIDGRTLEERIATGPLPLTEARRIALEVARALETAHEKDIVHRDIKAANVMLTAKGQAKVLDFGLAQTAASTKLTRMGSTLGTVAYMSPEQARGEVVDHRTDIWSLGAMLYEMVAGTAPFGGDYEQAVIYSILNAEPEPLTALRTGVPMELERIVSKCLAKEAGRRYSTTADLIVDLENLDVSVAGTSRTAVSTSRVSATRSPGSVVGWWGPAAGALIVGVLLGWWLFGSGRGRPVEQAVVRFSAGIIDSPVGGFPVISDDGKWIAAFAGHGMGDDEPVLQVRSLESREVIRMQPAPPTGTMRFSPDGRSIVIPTTSGLQQWSMDGGSPQLVTPQENILWFTWTGERGVLYTGMMDSVLYEVAGPNDTPSVFDPDEPLYIGFPYQIPGSDILLYYAYLDPDEFEDGMLKALDRSTGRSVELIRGSLRAKYHPDGYIVYYRAGALYAASFDPRAMVVGEPFVVQEGVAASPPKWFGGFDVASSSGALVYFRGGSPVTSNYVLESWENGTSSPLEETAGRDIWEPEVSLDGSWILFQILDPVNDDDIWLLDRRRKVLQQLTFDEGESEYPVFGPDGETFYYTSHHNETLTNTRSYTIRRPLGNGSLADTLLESRFHPHVDAVTKDGRQVVLEVYPTLTASKADLYLLDTETRQVEPLLETPRQEYHAELSPDERLLAYVSDESGRPQVFTRSFPDMGEQTLISPGVGDDPKWASDGSALFYYSRGTIQRVAMDDGIPGVPETYLELDPRHRPFTDQSIYSLVPEGEVVYVRSLDTPQLDDVEVVLGFGSIIRQLDPARQPE